MPRVLSLPNPDYSPFASVSVDILTVVRPYLVLGGRLVLVPLWWRQTMRFASNTPHEPRRGGLNLVSALQYGSPTGLARMRAFIREFAERIYNPVYDD